MGPRAGPPAAHPFTAHAVRQLLVAMLLTTTNHDQAARLHTDRLHPQVRAAVEEVRTGLPPDPRDRQSWRRIAYSRAARSTSTGCLSAEVSEALRLEHLPRILRDAEAVEVRISRRAS